MGKVGGGPFIDVLEASNELPIAPVTKIIVDEEIRSVMVNIAVATDTFGWIQVCPKRGGIQFGFGGTGILPRDLLRFTPTAVVIWRNKFNDYETEIPPGDLYQWYDEEEIKEHELP